MSTIIPYFDPILGKLRNSDVALISLASLIVSDPLVVNNLIVNSNASINTLKTISISNSSTITSNLISTNGIVASTATIGTAHISNIEWNLTSGATVVQEGQMSWDTTQQTTVLGMAGGNVNVALGMEQLFPRRVRNSTGSTMAKGTVVYINGVSGNTPTVARAIATSDSTSAFTLGMTAEDIANNGTGWVTTFGELTGINLSSFTGGDTLYLSGATAGAFTNIPQSAPIHYVRVGTVVKATADGALVVNVLNGYELQELHNVVISSLASGQILQSGASSLWYNRSLASAVNDFIVFPAFPSLGSLAVLNSLSYYALDSRLSLGSLAVQNNLSYYSLDSRLSLGSLAVLNDLSYTSLTNLPSLGSLAVQNNLSYFSLDSRLSLGSLAVLNSLSYTSLTNLPSLGSFAIVNTAVSPLVLSGATLSLSQASIVHDNLGGLTTGDPHTQYALLAGRSGGQTLFGGTVANNPLSLRANSVTGNSENSDGIRFGVGDSGSTNALILSQNGKLFHTVATPTSVNGYTLNQTITGTTGDSIGAFYNVTDTGGGVKTIFAHRARLTYSGSGSISGIQSTSNQMVVDGGGTVNAAEILTSNLTVENNSTVNNAKLIRLFTPTVQTGGVITGLTGIDIPDLTVAQANAYAIYSDGGKSYHKGNFGFGTISDPLTQIHYSGVMTGEGAVFTSQVSIQNLAAFGITANSGVFSATVSVAFIEALSGVFVNKVEVDYLQANTGVFASQVSVNTINSNGIFASTASFGVITAGNVRAGDGYLSVNNSNLAPLATGATGDILAGNANGNFQYDASTAYLNLEKSIGNAQGIDFAFYKSRGATASPSIVTAGDDIGLIRGYAYQASAYTEVTRITLETLAGGATNSGVIRFYTANAGTIGERVVIMNDGDVGIGVTAPAQKLDVNGRIRMATWTADGDTAAYRDTATNCIALVTSDVRLKKDLEVIPNALDKIKSLSGYTYRRIDDEEYAKKKYGVIAQEVLAVAPELTFEFTNEDDPNTYYSVHYDKLPALLIQAVKEQQAIIEDLKARIEVLEAR
jgi:hypothetical protein